MPKAAPTRARPTTTRSTAGQPPRATSGASQTRPPPSARQRRCWLVSAWRQTRAAPAQAKATGQNRCWLRPQPLVCTSHSRPVARAARASMVPQSIRRFGLTAVRIPVRLAASRPGAVSSCSGGSSNHRAPYAIAPRNCTSSSPTNPIRITITGQPRCRASPVQTPPRIAPSATRVARGRDGFSSAPGPAVSSGIPGVSVGAPMAGRSEASGWRCAPKPVVDMMTTASHSTGSQTSRVTPERTPTAVPTSSSGRGDVVGQRLRFRWAGRAAGRVGVVPDGSGRPDGEDGRP